MKKQGGVLSWVRKSLSYTDPPFETTSMIDPAKVGLIDVPHPFETPNVPMAAVSASGEPKAATGNGLGTPLVRRLPGRIAALAVGGAGRYLLLQLKGQRRLVVFDAQRADFLRSKCGVSR